MKAKQTEHEGITRIKLSETQELVASIVNNEKMDFRVCLDTDRYKGWTRNGLRFYLYDDNWPEFKKLIDKVDKVYKEL